MDWTFGPLDYFFLDYFLDRFLDHFFDLFFYPIFLWISLSGGGDTPLVLREWWDAVNQYLRRGERVRGILLLLKEWWEVVIEVNATDWWSIYWIIQLFFRQTILLPKLKFLSWAVTLGWAFVMRMRNSHRNTGLQLLLKIWPILALILFPLYGQYIISRVIYLPFVIDFIRRQRSRNFWCLALN